MLEHTIEVHCTTWSCFCQHVHCPSNHLQRFHYSARLELLRLMEEQPFQVPIKMASTHKAREIHQIDLLMIKISDGSNYVWSSMFDRSKPKIGCLSSITNRWTRSCSLDVRKSDIRVSSMSNLVNIVKALLGSKFDCSKPKIGCSSSITNKWTHSSSFDVRKMMFEFDRCSIKWCSTNHSAASLAI